MMKDIAILISFISDHIDTILTVSVTILGFVITYFKTKQSFSNEVRKSKIAHNVEIIHSLPFDLGELMTRIQKQSANASAPRKDIFISADYEALMTKILAYGSADAVKIATEIQQTSFRSTQTGEDCGKRLLILYALLITQLKYDISDEIISPESWFRLKINDYETTRNDVIQKINEYVDVLKLNKKFHIKQ